MITEDGYISEHSLDTCADSIHLPVLDALIANFNTTETNAVLDKTLIYYVHHPLQTSINVIDSFVALGARYENIFILGKKYSQNDDVVNTLKKRGVHYQSCSMQLRSGHYSTSFIRDINWLWFQVTLHLNKDIENILILDHGGHAVTYFPSELLENYRIVGIEKTSAGFFDMAKRGMPPFPMIDVANCLAKQYLESPLIAKAVVTKLFDFLPKTNQKTIYGVVGLGAVGKAIIDQLSERGHKIVIHDIKPEMLAAYKQNPQFICADDTRDLISVCDWVFGCSGRDIIESSIGQLKITPHDKTFVSCSSEDKEFLSLLRFIDLKNSKKAEIFETIEYHSELGAKIKILRGGFPANFDNSGESVPSNEIQLTRALVVAALLQAVTFLQDELILSQAVIHPLNLQIQKFIVHEWLQHQSVLGGENSMINKHIEVFSNLAED